LHTQSTESEPVLSGRPPPEERLLPEEDPSLQEERPLLEEGLGHLEERPLLEEPRLRQGEEDPKKDNLMYYII